MFDFDELDRIETSVLDDDLFDWMSSGVVEEFDSETLALLKEF